MQKSKPSRPTEDAPEIAVQRSCPNRYVFTEDGNPEGWIGTDLAVEIPR